MNKTKVFGIGMYKTGTTTLGEVFKTLGYNHIKLWSNYSTISDWKNQSELIESLAESHDTFEDYPWMYCYKRMYELYPDAKFVMTLRPVESFRKSEINVRLKEGWSEEDSIKDVDNNIIPRYYKHLEEAREFFKGKDNYLEVNWFEGDKWNKICEFLEVDMPSVDFPHLNKGKYK